MTDEKKKTTGSSRKRKIVASGTSAEEAPYLLKTLIQQGQGFSVGEAPDRPELQAKERKLYDTSILGTKSLSIPPGEHNNERLVFQLFATRYLIYLNKLQLSGKWKIQKRTQSSPDYVDLKKGPKIVDALDKRESTVVDRVVDTLDSGTWDAIVAAGGGGIDVDPDTNEEIPMTGRQRKITMRKMIKEILDDDDPVAGTKKTVVCPGQDICSNLIDDVSVQLCHSNLHKFSDHQQPLISHWMKMVGVNKDAWGSIYNEEWCQMEPDEVIVDPTDSETHKNVHPSNDWNSAQMRRYEKFQDMSEARNFCMGFEGWYFFPSKLFYPQVIDHHLKFYFFQA